MLVLSFDASQVVVGCFPNLRLQSLLLLFIVQIGQNLLRLFTGPWVLGSFWRWRLRFYQRVVLLLNKFLLIWPCLSVGVLLLQNSLCLNFRDWLINPHPLNEFRKHVLSTLLLRGDSRPWRSLTDTVSLHIGRSDVPKYFWKLDTGLIIDRRVVHLPDHLFFLFHDMFENDLVVKFLYLFRT